MIRHGTLARPMEFTSPAGCLVPPIRFTVGLEANLTSALRAAITIAPIAAPADRNLLFAVVTEEQTMTLGFGHDHYSIVRYTPGTAPEARLRRG